MVRGVRIDLHPAGDYVSDAIRTTDDFYEAPILDYIRDHHPEQRTIVDVGAHIGNHTLYFANFLRHDVIWAFEPLPANFDLLARNVADDATVRPYNLALSDKARVLWMTPGPDNLGASKVDPDGTVPIVADSLDLLHLDNVTLLKIDVEGHERQVLEGARATIARCRPLVVIEDWSGAGYAELLPGYRLVREWELAHQTFMFEPAA